MTWFHHEKAVEKIRGHHEDHTETEDDEKEEKGSRGRVPRV